ncbi:MAG: cysteine desulfurase-like protein [Pseudomonadales bacterium]
MPSSFPIDDVRAQFPSLSVENRIYFDNPAGTQVPASVASAVADCLLYSNANLGGHFATSRAADGVVANAHSAMADFYGATDADEIIVGGSMSALTFHLSRSISHDFKPGDEIILTNFDHEGNVAPWLHIAQDKGLVVRWAEVNRDTWRIEPESVAALITDKTRLLALGYASNFMGAVNNVKHIVALAREADVLTYVDAVQYAPHGQVDVSDLGCDFLVSSSYKFFGPHLGVLWGRRALLESLPAYKCRCSPEDLPWRFETGTSSIEQQAGLSAAVDYFAWLGNKLGEQGSRRAQIVKAFDASQHYEAELITPLLEGLLELPGVEVYGPTPDAAARGVERVPTVSFRHNSLSPDHIARSLADEQVFVWQGHNYAFEMAKSLGIEAEGGVRIGLAHYNTASEVERTLAVLSKVLTA